MSFRLFLESREEDGFLNAILDNPRDDGTYLIYADWLEERGSPFAGFLRGLVAANRETNQKKKTELNRSLRELSNQLRPYLYALRNPTVRGIGNHLSELGQRPHILLNYRGITYGYIPHADKPFFSNRAERDSNRLYDSSDNFPVEVMPLMIIQTFLHVHPIVKKFFDRFLHHHSVETERLLPEETPANVDLPRVNWERGQVCMVYLGRVTLIFNRGGLQLIISPRGSAGTRNGSGGDAFFERYGHGATINDQAFNNLSQELFGQHFGLGWSCRHFAGDNTTEVTIGRNSLYFSYNTLIAFGGAGRLAVRLNPAGNTTARHISEVRQMYSSDVENNPSYPANQFAARYHASIGRFFS